MIYNNIDDNSVVTWSTDRRELVVQYFRDGLVDHVGVHVPARSLHEQPLDVHALLWRRLQLPRTLHLDHQHKDSFYFIAMWYSNVCRELQPALGHRPIPVLLRENM